MLHGRRRQVLKISPAMLSSFEQSLVRARPIEFGRWYQRYAHVLGPLDRFTTYTLFDKYAAEGGIAEIDPMDDEIFVWVAARYCMPNMDDRQYLATMDVIFSELSDENKLAKINQIAFKAPRYGQ